MSDPQPGSLVVRSDQVLIGMELRPAEVLIEHGIIIAVEPIGTFGASSGRRLLDAQGRVVLPGAVDAHVHGNDPGRAEWEGLATLTAAAAAGGVTTIVDMPIDSDPPTLSAGDVAAKVAIVDRAARIDVALWGGLVPANLSQLDGLLDAGVVGFKAFRCSSGWDGFPAADDRTFAQGCRVAAARRVPVVVHAEHDEGRGTIENEVAAVRAAATLAASAGARLHIAHVSAADAVLEAARWPDVRVETCPHYLVLDDLDAARLAGRAHCSPPIRDAANRERLWRLLRDGYIDTLASDHSPCLPAMKAGPAPWAGVAAVQTTLGVLLAAGLELAELSRLSTAAARLLGLAGKGRLAVGCDGDLALVDPAVSYVLDADQLHQRWPELSPYLGRRLQGRIDATLVRGATVFAEGTAQGEPIGRFVAGPARRGA